MFVHVVHKVSDDFSINGDLMRNFPRADAGAIRTAGDTWISGSTGFDESAESSWAARPVGGHGAERATESVSARRANGTYEPHRAD